MTSAEAKKLYKIRVLKQAYWNHLNGKPSSYPVYRFKELRDKWMTEKDSQESIKMFHKALGYSHP